MNARDAPTPALILRCACGTLGGTLGDAQDQRSTRIVCYCADCRAFARWLDADAPPHDADGGSDILQVSPARLAFSEGIDRLACFRLSPRGLLRWYASCCRTPVCNTVDARQLPFAGVSTRFVHTPDVTTLEGLIGAVRHGVQAGREHGIEAPWPVHAGVPFALIAGSIRNIGGWRLRGDHRRSPLSDPDTGEPAVAPEVLSAAERATL